MDSLNSSEQRLFTEMYTCYMIFMAIVFASYIKFIRVPVMISTKRIKISATLFFINFFVAWFALQQTTCVLVAHSYPITFNVVFYTTMISAPAVLCFTSSAIPVIFAVSVILNPSFGVILRRNTCLC